MRCKTLYAVLAAVLVILATFPKNGWAQPDEVRLPPDEWHGVYQGTQKLGYAAIHYEKAAAEEGSVYRVNQEEKIRLNAGPVSGWVLTRTFLEFDAVPPYGFRRARVEVDNGIKSLTTVRVDCGEGQCRIVLDNGEAQQEITANALDFTLNDQLAVRNWIQAKPETGARKSFKQLDLQNLDIKTSHLEVKTLSSTITQGVSTVFREVGITRSDGAVQDIAYLDSSGTIVYGTINRQLELRIETAQSAKSDEQSAGLDLKGVAFVDKPLGDPAGIKSLELEVVGGGGEVIVNSPRQFAAVDKEFNTVKVRSGSVRSQGKPASESDIRENLAESPRYPITNVTIAAMAREAAGNAVSDLDKVRSLLAFVDNFIKDETRFNESVVETILEEKRGDCSEHALLFTTLARAAGIPAREVFGLAYMGDAAMAFGLHAWNEAVVDGYWTPVDAIFNQMSPDAAHIQLDDGSYPTLEGFRVLKIENLDPPIEPLKAEVERLMASVDQVVQRRGIDKFYTLADIYERQGRAEDAVPLYDKALRADPWNLERQMKFAELVQDSNVELAIQKAQLVYRFSEESQLIHKAESFLESHGRKIPVPVGAENPRDDLDYVLVPMDENVNWTLMRELRALLEKRLNVKVSLSKEIIVNLGPPQRTVAEAHVERILKEVRKQYAAQPEILAQLQIPAESAPQDEKVAYLEFLFDRSKPMPGRGRFELHAKLAEYRNQKQYYYDPLADILENRFQVEKTRLGSIKKAYIGVTSAALGCPTCNFLFGSASTGAGYGVVSYAQFTALNNGENQNRERLLDRTLKQALSTTLFALGIPRCSNPFCGRAYPNSVQEQDQKDDELCDECRAKLTKYVNWVRLPRHLDRAVEYSRRKQWDRCIEEYMKALEIAPDNPEIMRRLGVAYSDKKDYEQSEHFFRKVYEADPNNARDACDLGYALYLKGNSKEAVELLKKSVTLDAGNGLCHYNLALAYYRIGEHALAKEALGNAKSNGYEGSQEFAKRLEPY